MKIDSIGNDLGALIMSTLRVSFFVLALFSLLACGGGSKGPAAGERCSACTSSADCNEGLQCEVFGEAAANNQVKLCGTIPPPGFIILNETCP